MSTFPRRPVFRSGPFSAGFAFVVLLLALPAFGQEPEEPERPPTGAVVPPEDPGGGDSVGYDVETETAKSGGDTEAARPEVARARLVDGSDRPGHRAVKEIRRLRQGVGRIEWSSQGEQLAFDRAADTGFRALFVGNALAGTERCLSCGYWDLRKSHVLAPTWHPSGRMTVAMVQGPAAKLGMETWTLAGPDRGLHSELWAFPADGGDPWQLTNVVPQGGAVMDPHFSYEGDRLAWTRRVDTTVGGRWGSWEVRVADFQIKRGVPRLKNIRELDVLPWPGWVAVHGFTEDDKGLWLTVSPTPGSADKGGRRGLMSGRYDFESGRFTPLPGAGDWDVLPSSVPRDERRVWVSDRGIERPRAPRLPWRGDLWLASESGRRQERLTFFNDPSSDHYLGEAWIADTTWSPDGEHLLVQVLAPDETKADEATGGGEGERGRRGVSPAVVEYLYEIRLDPAALSRLP